MQKDKKMVWLHKDVLKLVDVYARNMEHTPLGEKVNIQGSVEKLIETHPDIAAETT